MSSVQGRLAEADRPPAAFRTISEAAEELDLPQHVLRFWETRFSQIRPLKRGGGRRYYRREDVDLLRGIKHLLYGQGYTIRGVQRILKAQGVKFVQNVWSDPASLQLAGLARPEGDEHEDDIPSGAVSAITDVAPLPSLSKPVDASLQGLSDETAGRQDAASPKMSEQSRQRLRAALADLMEARRLLRDPNAGQQPAGLDEIDDG